MRDIGPLSGAKLHSSVRSCTADGRPLLGQHPGFVPGRVVVVASASGAEPYGPGSCSSSYQLSPMLAKMAGGIVRSAGASGSESAVLQGLAAQRGGVSVTAVDRFDGWEGLGVLQHAQATPQIDLERAADEAADQRQDLAWQEDMA